MVKRSVVVRRETQDRPIRFRKAMKVNDSPPMPAAQAPQSGGYRRIMGTLRETDEPGCQPCNAPFSIDVNASQTGQLRREEEAYYALRNSFIPLWTLYISNIGTFSDTTFDIDVPVPFCHESRREYDRFFERYGTHYIKRA
jgi:hypothetical protein